MISFALVLLLFQPTFAFAPKPTQTQFDVRVLVVVSQTNPKSAHPDRQRHALLDGQCVELEGSGVAMLDPGEYNARLIWGPVFSKLPNRYDLVSTYEFLLPDGSTRRFELTGLGVGDINCPAHL